LRRAARRLLLAGLLVFTAGGSSCAGNYRIASAENFYTYERPFTDASAEVVRKDADTLCQDRKMDAIRTSDVCDMTRCFTNYQCVGRGEAQQLVR
jgi:hypothetical protein